MLEKHKQEGSSMCKPQTQGGYRCPDHDRLRKLTSDDLVARGDGTTPQISWQQNDLRSFWVKEAEYRTDQCAAILKLESIKAFEPSITAEVRQIAAQVDGECVNLHERLRSPRSVALEISDVRNEAAKHGIKISSAEVAEQIKDIVRYFIVRNDHAGVKEAAVGVVEGLQTKGWEVEEISHSYVQNSPDKHLKLVGKTPSNIRVDIHVTSALSIQAEDEVSALDEVYKTRSVAIEDRKVAREIRLEHFQQIPTPQGLENIVAMGRKDIGRVPVRALPGVRIS